MRTVIFHIILLSLLAFSGYAQEATAPVNYNPVLKGRSAAGNLAKSTALTLPLFEDFTGYSPYPDSTIWADYEVYVNNTMCVQPISRGVATFDALSQYGVPYDTINTFALVYADSLTLKPMDISAHQPSDSLYLSFFVQPQGMGFAPETADSLLLFFKKGNGTWVKVWAREGNVLAPFRQVMVPVLDPDYFHANFQFRFVNKASINTNDDVWNLDYIRMDINRTSIDTAVDDVAFTSDPGYMLNDYTYMPYRHFMVNPGGELSAQITDTIRNGYNFNQSVNYFFTAREIQSGTPLFSNGASNASISPFVHQGIAQPTYANNVPVPTNVQDKVVFENKFYIQSVSGTDHKNNDTVVKQQIFDNYLAYDDGTAEKSYYLNMFPSLPGKIAIEHHLNEPDVLQGVAIYFGRQVPTGSYKEFSIAVYKKLQGVNGEIADELVYQQDLMYPQYLEVNNYYTYQITSPVNLGAGTFYIATIQPALSGSDSLYFGLDVNRIQGNHAYYNVDGTWNESTVSGAIMIRPMVGQTVFNTGMEPAATAAAAPHFTLYPNPAVDKVVCRSNSDKPVSFTIVDMQGRQLMRGVLPADKSIDVSALLPGMYFIRMESGGVYSAPQKLIKQ
ncbi:MAG: T9SS type A sorting domain-containing protein [Flavipsychrobacter sp.]|nr:T9SS type A sorting domain-containing protein [Flavipsychrobacter sp.]